jgi:hypothetical protein
LFDLNQRHDMKLDQSANGAAYDSQGQVRSEAEHVAPGDEIKFTCQP